MRCLPLGALCVALSLQLLRFLYLKTKHFLWDPAPKQAHNVSGENSTETVGLGETHPVHAKWDGGDYNIWWFTIARLLGSIALVGLSAIESLSCRTNVAGGSLEWLVRCPEHLLTATYVSSCSLFRRF